MKIPAVGGSYVLSCRLENEATINSGPFAGKLMGRGLYLYSGSALGPGGLHARISRHLRPEIKKFWHIDHIKALIEIREIWYIVKEKKLECEFIRVFQDLENVYFQL